MMPTGRDIGSHQQIYLRDCFYLKEMSGFSDAVVGAEEAGMPLMWLISMASKLISPRPRILSVMALTRARTRLPIDRICCMIVFPMAVPLHGRGVFYHRDGRLVAAADGKQSESPFPASAYD